MAKATSWASTDAHARKRARLEAAIGAIDALIRSVDGGGELRARAAEGLEVLRALVASTVIEFDASPASPTLTLPQREGTVKGRIL